MGIFTKKREESVVTPLPSPRPEGSPAPKAEREPERKPQAAPAPAPEASPKPAAQPRPEASVKAPSPKAPPSPEFGIQNAMELMRKLPPDNVPLVVSVVKTTLESLHIDVESIIDDAKQKRAKIAERISGLESEIAELEEEVAARREEIKALQEDGAETKLVQERLQMASGEPVSAGASASASRPDLASILRPPGG
jgi:outer membrane murein-binding lipoprotein Lpp